MSVFSGQCKCGCTELINHITMWECPHCGNEYRDDDDGFSDGEEDDFYDEFSFLDDDFEEEEDPEEYEELNFG